MLADQVLEEIEWDDRFDVGVPFVDAAHQKLFSIVKRITNMAADENKSRFAAIEGLKYFKNYTMQHFNEEEAYMRKIHYPHYEMHHRIHTALRDETLPQLEARLNASDYSMVEVKHFVGVCVGWLVGHIMIVDQMITGKSNIEPPTGDLQTRVSAAFTALVQQLFGLSASSTSMPPIPLDSRTMFYRAVFQNEIGDETTVLLTMDNDFAFSVSGEMSGLRFFEADTLLVSILRGLLQLLSFSLVKLALYPYDDVASTTDGLMTADQANALSASCNISMPFDTAFGRIALYVKTA